jgi:hypothetical protein
MLSAVAPSGRMTPASALWGPPRPIPSFLFLILHYSCGVFAVKLGLVRELGAAARCRLPMSDLLPPVPEMHEQAIERAVFSIFADSELHAKQVLSIAHSVIGVASAAHAGVASIGRAAASARESNPKHGIKQFDKFLSNEKSPSRRRGAAISRTSLAGAGE